MMASNSDFNNAIISKIVLQNADRVLSSEIKGIGTFWCCANDLNFLISKKLD